MKTPDYVVFMEYNELKKDPDIRFWHKFTQSDRYKSYLRTLESNELERLNELSKLTCTDDFNSRVAYLKDKKRFLKSDEYKNVLSFNELDKSKFMAEYRKLKKARELDFFEKWEIVLDENFDGNELNSKLWQPENWWGSKLADMSFSQESEMQSFQGMRNIHINNHTLSLVAKKEKSNGKAWSPSIGLIPKQYEYSSSIINSADSFRIREGVLETKVRFKKDPTIISSFSLTGEKPFPQIDLFRSTKNGVGMGILEKQESVTSKYCKLSALNDQNYHIFRLELFKDQLVWKINGYEVFRESFTVHEPLFFHLLTSLHGEVNEHLLPHKFEVEWIRCFSAKS
jgi:hypothetical protein